MKKIIAIMLAALSLLSLAACGAKEADYKLGMGVELSTASSKENNAQVDATVAAVILDANGKIVQCRIDVAQNKMDVTGGALTPPRPSRPRWSWAPATAWPVSLTTTATAS